MVGLVVDGFLGGGSGDADGREGERWGMERVLDVDLGKR